MRVLTGDHALNRDEKVVQLKRYRWLQPCIYNLCVERVAITDITGLALSLSSLHSTQTHMHTADLSTWKDHLP